MIAQTSGKYCNCIGNLVDIKGETRKTTVNGTQYTTSVNTISSTLLVLKTLENWTGVDQMTIFKF